MKTDHKILEETESFVSEYLKEKASEFSYHNLAHTEAVVENAKLIGTQEKLNEHEMNMLLISAWFHDTGYAISYSDHEKESARIAENFLSDKKVEKDIIKEVSSNIEATKFPHHPKTKLAGILCDADFMHLGKDNYFELAEKLRKEQSIIQKEKIKKSAFNKKSLEVFIRHSYFSNYCLQNCTDKKNDNLQKLKEKIIKQKKKKKAKQKLSTKYSRGVDSMFKLTARNQINLSSIADNKSNILISLNGIIISLGIAGLVSKFREEPAIIIPSVIFMLFSLTTIVLAILSTRPHISSGKFSREDIRKRSVNLLFFGNFYRMSLADYEWAIREMINDDQYLYSTMTKDQFALGIVLARKYKLLRWAYNVFMVGLVVSVFAFLIVFLQL